MSLDGSGSMEERWMIIYSDEDSSHSLVPERDVICEPSVEVGDKVQFIYGPRSRSRPLEGIVKAIGDDALELQKLMKAMNKKDPKKDGSFHEERQRSAKLKCINKFNNKPVSPKKSKKAPCKETEQQFSSAQPKTPLEKVLSGNSDDSSNEESSLLSDGNMNVTDKNDSDSSSQEELTSEQVKTLLKVAKGKKCKDLKALLNLSVNSKSVGQKGPSKVNPKSKAKKVDKEPIYSTDEETENEEESKAGTSNDKKDKSREKTLIVSTKSASSSKVMQDDELENSNQDSISDKNASEKSASSIKQMEDNVSKRSQSPHHDSETEPLRKKVKRPRKVKYEKVTFDGNFYRFSSKDLNCRKLHKNYNVYVNENNLTEIKRNAKTLLTVARHLTEEVYSDKAILACTVSGRPSSARPGVPSTIKPALDPEGVKAIYNYITDRARTKKLPVPSFTEVKKAIGGILNETRYNAALHAEAEKKMGGSPS